MLSAIPLDLFASAFALLGGTFLLARSWAAALKRDRQRRRPTSRPRAGETANDPAAPGCVEGSGIPTEARTLDLAAEVRGALHRLDALAARQGVRFDVAVQSGLQVHLPQPDLRCVLDDVLSQAIRQSPGGKVMIGGMRHGGRVQIAILGDGAGSDRDYQESLLRDTMRCVALRGGTIEVNCRPGEGSLVVMRLPDPDAASAKRPASQDIASPRATASGADGDVPVPALAEYGAALSP